MLKSFIEWLLEKVPVSNWAIIVWLFGLAIICAVEIKNFANRNGES